MSLPFNTHVCFGYLLFLEQEFLENIDPGHDYTICKRKTDGDTTKAHELMTKRMHKRIELKKLHRRMTDAIYDWGLGNFANFTPEINEGIYMENFQACEHILNIDLNDDF